MSRKNIVNGQERFDGFAVTLYDGKFSSSFDLDEDTALELGFDDIVTFVVTARVGGVNFSETKVGDVKRTNTFAVTNAVVLEPQLMAKISALLPGVNGNQPSFDDLADDDDDDDDVVAPVAATAAAPQSGPLAPSDPVLAGFLNQ